MAPRGLAVRPTPARVKEALFSILATRIPDARVLDLYAGSGALGFEALSRGAAHVTFVESHRPTAAALRAAATELGVVDRTMVVGSTAERVAGRLSDRFDIVFADPPYALPYPAATFAHLGQCGRIDAQTIVVYEHSSTIDPPSDPRFAVVRTARYGAVALAFLLYVA